MVYSQNFRVIWVDIDANRHMRHSAYYDYAAQVRVMYFEDHGLGLDILAKMGVGPVLFREEAVFYREVHLNEELTVFLALASAREDGSRWTLKHDFFRKDGVKAATITVDGAWMDLRKRKLAEPPEKIKDLLVHMPEYEKNPD